MHSFHRSRGRILFDVACAFGMSGFCGWAWVQTYATAMLGAAGVAGLYGLVRFTDLFRRASVVAQETAVGPTPVVEPEIVAEPVAAAPEQQRMAQAPLDVVPAKHDLPPEVVAALVRKPKTKVKRPAKVKRLAEEAPAAESDPAEVAVAASEPHSTPIAPLFEPEPFLRQQQRAAFGRKFGAR
jgi:hypothetical protein